MSPSTLVQRCFVYLATDLTHGTPHRELAEQDLRSAWFTRAHVEHMIHDGTLKDAKSCAAYTLLLLTEHSSRQRALPKHDARGAERFG
jgi:hypothetical protein